MRNRNLCLIAILSLLSLGACRPAEPEGAADAMPERGAVVPAPATYPPDVAAQIDSGNAAYSAGEFADALRHYRLAAEAGPAISATWFGVYMANHALGNLEAADSALAKARAQAPGETASRPPPPDSAAAP